MVGLHDYTRQMSMNDRRASAQIREEDHANHEFFPVVSGADAKTSSTLDTKFWLKLLTC